MHYLQIIVGKSLDRAKLHNLGFILNYDAALLYFKITYSNQNLLFIQNILPFLIKTYSAVITVNSLEMLI